MSQENNWNDYIVPRRTWVASSFVGDGNGDEDDYDSQASDCDDRIADGWCAPNDIMHPRDASRKLNRVIVECVGTDEEGVCPICHEGLKGKPTTYLPCGHALHVGCHIDLRQSRCEAREKCPVCRTSFLNALPRGVKSRMLRERRLIDIEVRREEAISILQEEDASANGVMVGPIADGDDESDGDNESKEEESQVEGGYQRPPVPFPGGEYNGPIYDPELTWDEDHQADMVAAGWREDEIETDEEGWMREAQEEAAALQAEQDQAQVDAL